MLTTGLLPVMALNLTKSTNPVAASVFLFESSLDTDTVKTAIDLPTGELALFIVENSISKFTCNVETRLDGQEVKFAFVPKVESYDGDVGYSYQIDKDIILNTADRDVYAEENIKARIHNPIYVSYTDAGSIKTNQVYSFPSDVMNLEMSKLVLTSSDINNVSTLNLLTPIADSAFRLCYGYYSGGTYLNSGFADFEYKYPISADLLVYQFTRKGQTYGIGTNTHIAVYYFDTDTDRWVEWIRDSLKSEGTLYTRAVTPSPLATRWRVTSLGYYPSGSGSNRSAMYLSKFGLGNRNVVSAPVEFDVDKAIVYLDNQLDSGDMLIFKESTSVALYVDISKDTVSAPDTLSLDIPTIEGNRVRLSSNALLLGADI